MSELISITNNYRPGPFPQGGRCCAGTRNAIAVDLDGTLIKTDALVESVFLFLRTYPWRIWCLLPWLMKGKAYFKRSLANFITPDAKTLPYNQELIAWLQERKSTGSQLILATASDRRIAQSVADHLGFFDEVMGTEERNLSSKIKRDALTQRYGEHGFEYVGNSSADLAVWKSAAVMHVVNPERGVLAAVRQIGKPELLVENRPPYFATLFKAMRLHQWAKNILLFVPLLASHRVIEVQLLMNGCVAFLSFGLCASSVYVLNDLLDLQDDRQHLTKCKRPLAAGTLPVLHGVAMFPLLLIAAFALAFGFLPIKFVGILAIYYALTLIYSLRLKRLVMLDVVALAMLYSVRVIAGAAAMQLLTTFWILAFCLFVFLSLAFVKRYTELRDARDRGQVESTAGRGYCPEDFQLLASLGGSSGYIAVLVLALYINDASHSDLYRTPEFMWGACPILLYWLSRVWLLAHRGQMNDDPVVFALRDRISRLVGALFILMFVLASYG